MTPTPDAGGLTEDERAKRWKAHTGPPPDIDIRDPRQVEIDRLKGEIAALQQRVEEAERTWIDDSGLSWSPPTARAYAKTCAARSSWQARAEEAKAEAEEADERWRLEAELTNQAVRRAEAARTEIAALQQRVEDHVRVADRLAAMEAREHQLRLAAEAKLAALMAQPVVGHSYEWFSGMTREWVTSLCRSVPDDGGEVRNILPLSVHPSHYRKPTEGGSHAGA